jgi:hypothetical protein
MKPTGNRQVTIPRTALGSILVVSVLLLAPCARAQDRAICSFSVGQPLRSRGDKLTLSVANGPAGQVAATVTLGRGGRKIALDGLQYAAANGGDTARVTGTIGPSVPLGGYLVDLALDKTSCSASDPQALVTVVPPGNPDVHLEPFDPAYSDVNRTVFFKKKRGSVVEESEVKGRVASLVLRGHGFQPDAADNQILINSVPQHVEPGDCAAGGADEKAVSGQIIAQVINDREIDLCLVPVPEDGQIRVQVAVGDHLSDQHIFRVYRFGKTAVALASGAIALILALLPLYLLSWIKDSYTISNQAYKLRLLFLDPETDSYSLSKLQFYLWTVAALFSYSYLFISRVLVQNVTWPDIPENLPGVIAVAAGTSISSLFITASKGSKGAGPIQPGFADFITSGGVVAPDRVQMLLWTLFGVCAFIVASLGDPPGTIKSLPTVPDNLLYLMGLSSAGYLGGKLARKAGPVVNEISISPADPDDAILSAAASSATDGPDFTDAIAAAQRRLTAGGTPTNAHAQAVLTALSDAVSAARAARNTEVFNTLLDTLGHLRQRAEDEALAAAQDFSGQPALAPEAAVAQAAAQALQEFCADVTLAIAQSASFHMREGLEIPRVGRTITVRGTNLSADALIQMDHADLPFRMLSNSEGKQMPEIVAREDASPTLVRVMQLRIDPAKLEAADFQQFRTWFGTKGVHIFTLTNPDGQMAEASFPLPPGEGQKSGTA